MFASTPGALALGAYPRYSKGMEDLFERTARPTGQEHLEPYQWLWAERVIREVSEEVAREERKAQDFVRAWVRWNDLSSFLNYVDLWMIRKGELAPSEKHWHETLLSGLISLGGLLREWAKTCDAETLRLVAYDSQRVSTLIESLKHSWDMWHGESNEATLGELTTALDNAVQG